jgi:hypothetical protein
MGLSWWIIRSFWHIVLEGDQRNPLIKLKIV